MLLRRILPPAPPRWRPPKPRTEGETKEINGEEKKEQEDVVDIFSTSLSLLFPDDVRNQHGEPGSTIIYSSPTFGELNLYLANPDHQEDRLLFAHHLWNAGVLLAALIEFDHSPSSSSSFPFRLAHPHDGPVVDADGAEALSTTEAPDRDGFKHQDGDWIVRDQTVLELGAGAYHSYAVIPLQLYFLMS